MRMKRILLGLVSAATLGAAVFTGSLLLAPEEASAQIKYMAGNSMGAICMCPTQVGNCVCAIVP